MAMLWRALRSVGVPTLGAARGLAAGLGGGDSSSSESMATTTGFALDYGRHANAARHVIRYYT